MARLTVLSTPRIDMPEGIALRSEVLLHGPVVDRPQNPHVERRGVPAHSRTPQIGLIGLDQIAVDGCKRNILLMAETGETPQRRRIGFTRAHTVQFPELKDQPLHEVEQHVGLRRTECGRQRFPPTAGHVLSERGQHALESFQIGPDLPLHVGQVLPSFGIGGGFGAAASPPGIPLGRKKPESGSHPLDTSVVNNLIE